MIYSPESAAFSCKIHLLNMKAHFLSFWSCTSTNSVTYVYKSTNVILYKISRQNCDRNLISQGVVKISVIRRIIVTVLRYWSIGIWRQQSIDNKFFLYHSVKESQVTIHQKNQIWIISKHSKHERWKISFR